MTVWRKAVSQFEVGATLKECIEIFLNTELVQKAPQEPSPIDSLVQRIYPPIYERVPENRDKTTFDYIRMTVGLPATSSIHGTPCKMRSKSIGVKYTSEPSKD